VHRAKGGSSSGYLPLKDSGNKVFGVSRQLSGRVASEVVSGSGVNVGVGAKAVVAEVRNRVSIEPSANSMDAGNGSRAAVVTHKEPLGDLTLMVKADNST
jgi:hypothetical protein